MAKSKYGLHTKDTFIKAEKACSAFCCLFVRFCCDNCCRTMADNMHCYFVTG